MEIYFNFLLKSSSCYLTGGLNSMILTFCYSFLLVILFDKIFSNPSHYDQRTRPENFVPNLQICPEE